MSKCCSSLRNDKCEGKIEEYYYRNEIRLFCEKHAKSANKKGAGLRKLSDIKNRATELLDALPLSAAQKTLMKAGIEKMSEEKILECVASLENALNFASTALAAAEAIIKARS